jgi:hypothetical protein
MNLAVRLLAMVFSTVVVTPTARPAEICGMTVTPHVVAESMRYRRPRDPELAAKVQLFRKGSAVPRVFDGKTPEELLQSGEWAWHDLGTAVEGPENSLSVWTWNGKSSRWGTGQTCDVEGDGFEKTTVSIAKPKQWISAITFLPVGEALQPRLMVAHVVNDSDAPLKISSVRFWLPRSNATWQTLHATPPLAVDVLIPPGERGIVNVSVQQPWPLTYAAIELAAESGSLWGHLRIKT